MTREEERLDRQKKIKAELLEMLGDDEPNYVQKEILTNLDKAISESEKGVISI